MKFSWIFWWIVSVLELSAFLVLSFMVWFREVDATGAIQTIELKWINIAILAVFFLLPFVMQLIWLIINLIYSRNKKIVH
ncbi:DUF3923 family protein [Staphylococcus equorum]|uniref:DUF3923 family protein n=2 Tax=Staphylococcus equorum TaxID=246432 RepID=A0A9X4L456_9STAP|nr:DUF3923 family protein [Staphylococcus equorum]MDG0819739.1 DUF3923 family protein [Staphylococcus equorum]MDG0825903.1 DUF3923 family protein [Staphylococcus equorum]MDG0840380.1 DUF3923 family protein [Staphylococcus equorum]MDG0846063.1 DUF3923 family protein [Staphylococcus equorum]PTE78941.1 DUF3923 domain-containing protein [Staphylococcus equorum]